MQTERRSPRQSLKLHSHSVLPTVQIKGSNEEKDRTSLQTVARQMPDNAGPDPPLLLRLHASLLSASQRDARC